MVVELQPTLTSCWQNFHKTIWQTNQHYSALPKILGYTVSPIHLILGYRFNKLFDKKTFIKLSPDTLNPNQHAMSDKASKQKVPYLESCNPRIHRVPYPPDIGLSLWYTLWRQYAAKRTNWWQRCALVRNVQRIWICGCWAEIRRKKRYWFFFLHTTYIDDFGPTYKDL